MAAIRDLIYFTLIAALGFFVSSFVFGSSIHFDSIFALLIVSASFTILNFAVAGRIADSIVLFFVNVFFVYLLDLLFPFFTVFDVWIYFIVTFIISVVDAVINDREL